MCDSHNEIVWGAGKFRVFSTQSLKLCEGKHIFPALHGRFDKGIESKCPPMPDAY